MRQLFFLLALVAAAAILTFVLPVSQKVKKSITISAPAKDIYDNLSKLENFNRVSIWSQADSSIVNTMKGTDGTVGASVSWKGSPEISGEGSIEITELIPDHTVSHKIQFSKPKKGKASSTFSVIGQDKKSTTVTWYFELHTPRPWNIFNLFYSLDKQMGEDFEKGLAALKLYMEAMNRPVP